MFKETILHKAVEELTDGTIEGVPKNVSHVNVAYETDETSHPTLQDTVDLLMQISQQLNIAESLVWNTNSLQKKRGMPMFNQFIDTDVLYVGTMD